MAETVYVPRLRTQYDETIKPNLIKEFTGGDTAAASEWNVVFGAVWGVMQLFCGPVLGMMSDRIGRRPILLIS